ncbi:MAG: hypothetical protein AB7O48_02910 [Cyclobacteriaceae bacterium]
MRGALNRILFTAGFAFVLVSVAQAQRDQGGFIVPNDTLQLSLPTQRYIYIPENGFTFFEVPDGDFKGKILPGPPLHLRSDPEVDSTLSATITGAYIRPQLLDRDNFFETSEDRYYVSFSKQQDGYIQILEHGYQGWARVDDIIQKGFKLVYWMEFYGETRGRMIHPREKTASILMSPYADAQEIGVADELYCEIISTGKCEGSYCSVKITQFKNPYDPEKTKEENILKKYKGWMRIIDDEGKPLVAHYSQGT